MAKLAPDGDLHIDAGERYRDFDHKEPLVDKTTRKAMETMGSNIRRMMEIRETNAHRIARRLHKNHHYIRKITKGETLPGIDLLIQMAKLLKFEPYMFLVKNFEERYAAKEGYSQAFGDCALDINDGLVPR